MPLYGANIELFWMAHQPRSFWFLLKIKAKVYLYQLKSILIRSSFTLRSFDCGKYLRKKNGFIFVTKTVHILSPTHYIMDILIWNYFYWLRKFFFSEHWTSIDEFDVMSGSRPFPVTEPYDKKKIVHSAFIQTNDSSLWFSYFIVYIFDLKINSIKLFNEWENIWIWILSLW